MFARIRLERRTQLPLLAFQYSWQECKNRDCSCQVWLTLSRGIANGSTACGSARYHWTHTAPSSIGGPRSASGHSVKKTGCVEGHEVVTNLQLQGTSGQLLRRRCR